MKFQVREGYVVRLIRKIDLGDDKTENQEITAYGGQVVNLTEIEAGQHTHKLEPKDREAESFLAAKVLPAAPAAQLGVSPEAMALVKAMASEMAVQIVAGLQAAAAPAPAA